MKTIIKSTSVEHPLEDVFDIEPGTTITEYKEITPDVPIQAPKYDDKDTEIEQKLEDIYTAAITNASVISDEIELVEGKYKARMGEVSATMLNVALAAVREKRELKQHKDKLSTATPAASTGSTPGTVTNNNLVIADRNEILRMLKDREKNNG